MRPASLILSLALLAGCAPKSTAIVAGTPAAAGVTFPVFFTSFSANLDAPAQAVIAQAADSARQHPGVPVIVSGFAAPQGSVRFNLDLSRARAQNVTDGLASAGVAAARITQHARGEIDYTADPIEARRVDISVGGGK